APVFRLSSGWIAVSAVQTGDICRWHIGNNACSYAATLCALRPCAQISLRHFARAFLLRSCRVTVPPSPPSGTVLHSTSPTQDALHLSLTEVPPSAFDSGWLSQPLIYILLAQSSATPKGKTCLCGCYYFSECRQLSCALK